MMDNEWPYDWGVFTFILPNGVKIEASSPQEAMLLATLLNKPETPAVKIKPADPWPTPPTDRPAAVAYPADTFDRLASTVKFLEAIEASGSSGIGIDVVMNKLITDKPKGVGGRLAIVNNMIKGADLSVANVYQTKVTAKGKRWIAGKDMAKALNALRRGG